MGDEIMDKIKSTGDAPPTSSDAGSTARVFVTDSMEDVNAILRQVERKGNEKSN